MPNVNYALAWDQIGERIFETGIDRGVIYPAVGASYPKGAAWNGLTGVDETPEGAEANDKYADNIKYLSIYSAETFKGTIKAFMYPDEFKACNGEADVNGVTLGQQSRKSFGLCYRTIVGNDTEGNDHGYKLHLVYGCRVAPSEKSYESVNDSPDAIELSWEFDTTPVVLSTVDPVTEQVYKPTSIITIDSTKVDAEKLAELEQALYGTAAEGGTPAVDGYLPLPDAVLAMFAE